MRPWFTPPLQWRRATTGLACLAAAYGCTEACTPEANGRGALRTRPAVTSVAIRVHHLEQMERFYSEAFGVRFRTVQTGPFTSRFGELDGVLLKLVPIRDRDDFTGFPVLQMGLAVDDIRQVVLVAVKHGGRIQDTMMVAGDSVLAAVRDPDGNTLELSQALHPGS